MNPVNVGQFHNDLKAVLTAKLPLVGNQQDRLTTKRIESLREQLDATELSQKLTPERIAELEKKDAFPTWYCAALTVFSKTGSMLPVLEGLSVWPRVLRNANQMIRRTFIYLVLVLVAALLGLSYFYFKFKNSVQGFLDHATLTTDNPVTTSFGNFDLSSMILVLLVVLGLVLVWTLAGGVSRAAMWLGGRGYFDNSMAVTVLRLCQSLMSTGMKSRDALELGFKLTGGSARIQDRVLSLVQEGDDETVIEQMASYYQLAASRCLAQLSRRTPMIAISVVGGLVTLLYCVVVFGAISSLIEQLFEQGV